jgi:hypothetical protein
MATMAHNMAWTNVRLNRMATRAHLERNRCHFSTQTRPLEMPTLRSFQKMFPNVALYVPMVTLLAAFGGVSTSVTVRCLSTLALSIVFLFCWATDANVILRPCSHCTYCQAPRFQPRKGHCPRQGRCQAQHPPRRNKSQGGGGRVSK